MSEPTYSADEELIIMLTGLHHALRQKRTECEELGEKVAINDSMLEELSSRIVDLEKKAVHTPGLSVLLHTLEVVLRFDPIPENQLVVLRAAYQQFKNKNKDTEIEAVPADKD